MSEMKKLWMPVTKKADGCFVGILSDSSIDRDEELMSPDLIRGWASDGKVLPALVNHDNSMQSLVGGWKNLKAVEKDGKVALVAEPFFFSDEANPLAGQIKKQAEEALEAGLNVGISIGAIPKNSKEVEIEGKNYKMWTKAEIVESSWVPVQSNRNATFAQVAKSFNISEKQNGELEVVKVNEDAEQEVQEPVAEAQAEEAQSEAPREEAEEESQESEAEEEAEGDGSEELEESGSEEAKEDKAKIAELEKRLAEQKKRIAELEKPIMRARVEGPRVEEELVEETEPSMGNLLKAMYGRR